MIYWCDNCKLIFERAKKQTCPECSDFGTVIKYWCNFCNLPLKGKECDNCGQSGYEIKYFCEICNIPTINGVCHVCSNHAKKIEKNKTRNHYWCSTCNIPLIHQACLNCGQEGKEIEGIDSDLKPVFFDEYNYYKEAAVKKLRIREDFFPKVLFRHGNNLISDISNGKTHYRITVDKNTSNTEYSLKSAGEFDISLREVQQSRRSRRKTYFLEDPNYIDKLIKGNLKYLEIIQNEAIEFIKDISNRFPDHYKITSFSGGKDSTVTAHLVKLALGDIPVVFSDTGIEYEETEKYVTNHGNDFGKLIYLDQEVNFLEMCKKLGPPSRTMRWCCFTNKGAPFSKFYANLEHKHVLSFDGIRKEESNLRANYPREMDNTKYEKQYSAYPILDWSTLEVWLYILWQKLPYNNLYNHGFSRIGCWACPNNTKIDWYLFSKVYPEQLKDWFNLINEYKLQQIETMKKSDDFGKDLKAYDFPWIEEGAWKSRRVKYHNEDNLLYIESPCGKHDFDLYLNHNVNENLIEFLKVFGKPIGTILPTGQKMFRIINNDVVISFIENGNAIKFYIQDEKKTQELKKLILRQINKFFNCVNCGACIGSCHQGAISINPHFQIDEDKCVNCLVCTGTKYLKLSCIAIHYKEERIIINLKKI